MWFRITHIVHIAIRQPEAKSEGFVNEFLLAKRNSYITVGVYNSHTVRVYH